VSSKVAPCNCGGQIKFWLYMHPKVCPKIYVVFAARPFLRIVWLSLFLLEILGVKQRWIVTLSSIWHWIFVHVSLW
jgi:hypothetical protein